MNLLVEAYKDLIIKDIDDFGQAGSRDYPFPSISKPNIVQLLHFINERLETRKPLLNLNGSFTVVGPVNGGIHKLLQMFHNCGMPPETKYIFLGNYIGDEEYSLEVITLLISMAATFPDSIILLKGANELENSPALKKFLATVDEGFDHTLYDLFGEFFSKLSLAATVSNATFVCHGGFGANSDDLMYIENAKLPKYDYDKISNEVILAEPSDDVDGFDGNKFGAKELTKFTKKTHVFRIIRAQQEKRIQGKIYSFASGKVLSLFYDLSGVIKIADDGSISTTRFKQLVPLKRKESYFITIDSIATILSSAIDSSKRKTRLKMRVRLPHANTSINTIKTKLKNKSMMIQFNQVICKTPL